MRNKCYRNSAEIIFMLELVRNKRESNFQSTKIGKTRQMGIPISGPKIGKQNQDSVPKMTGNRSAINRKTAAAMMSHTIQILEN